MSMTYCYCKPRCLHGACRLADPNEGFRCVSCRSCHRLAHGNFAVHQSLTNSLHNPGSIIPIEPPSQ